MYSQSYIGYRPATIGDLKVIPITTGEPTSTAIATVVATAVATIIDSINKGKPNPNDWMGWNALDSRLGYPLGTQVTGWIIQDGDSIQNEALNILQYIRAYGTNAVLGYNSHWGRSITAQDIANKLRRGGYASEADQLITKPANQTIQNVQQTLQKNNWLLYAGIGLTLIILLKK